MQRNTEFGLFTKPSIFTFKKTDTSLVSVIFKYLISVSCDMFSLLFTRLNAGKKVIRQLIENTDAFAARR